MAKVDKEKVLFHALLKKAQEEQAQGRILSALHVYERILAKRPTNAQVLGLAGQIYLTLGRDEDGRKVLEKAVKLQPTNPAFLNMLALAYRMNLQLPKAKECIDRALRLRPGEPWYLAAKAELEILSGNDAAAIELLEPCLKQTELNPNAVGVFARVAPKFDRTEEAVKLIERCLTRTYLPQGSRCQLNFSLGELLEKQNRYDDAFQAWNRANQFKGMRHDPAGFANAVDQNIRVWRRFDMATFPRSEVNASKFVFVVGMPGSGTGLVERILSGLPGVQGGERGSIPRSAFEINGAAYAGVPLLVNVKSLNAENVQRHAVAYANEVQALAPGAERFVDRNPNNFALLGLIQLMFPGARIIHCVRDPMDTCLSCYASNYGGFLPWAYHPLTIAHFYQQYRRMMAHWQKVLDLPLLQVSYEDIVQDLEGQSRRLVDFIDMPWNDSCLKLRPYRRLALTSTDDDSVDELRGTVNRWRNYESHLGQLQQVVGASSG